MIFLGDTEEAPAVVLAHLEPEKLPL